MAETLEIRGSQYRVKVRNPLAVALLTIVTLGIYFLVWWYKINRELRDFGRARGRDLGDSPSLSTLAQFPGSILIIPAWVSAWRGTGRVRQAARVAGQEPLIGWVALLLYIVIGIGWMAYLQDALNNVWRTEAVALPGQASVPALDEPVPALDEPMPPPLPSQPADSSVIEPPSREPPLSESERAVSPGEPPSLEPPGSSQP